MRRLTALGVLVMAAALCGCARPPSASAAAPRSSAREGQPSAVLRIDLASSRLAALDGWRYRSGDAATWASRDHDDSSWPIVGRTTFHRTDPGVHWYRRAILLEGERPETDVCAIRIVNLPAAAELYWDGVRLASNGTVGHDRSSERPGVVIWTVRIPSRRAEPGLHQLALRTSNWRVPARSPVFGITWGTVSGLDEASRSSTDRHLLYIGVYLTAALFCLALYIGTVRHRSYLVLFFYTALQGLSTAGTYAFESTRLAFPVYHLLVPVEHGWPFVHGIFLNLFFLYHFSIPRRAVHLLVMASLVAALVVAGVTTTTGNVLTSLTMSLYGVGLVTAAWRRGTPGAMAALAGMALLAAFDTYASAFLVAGSATWPSPKFLFGVGQGGSLACIVLAISMAIRADRHRFEALRLRSERLENELLKKSIQPHFIMNTLHSIKSWFHRDAEQAERLIEALAEEFRIISRVSGESAIDIDEEIRLCRHHLQIMGLRRAAGYALQVAGRTEGVSIPPLVLHTLVENGLTHAYEPGENGTFRLEIRDAGPRREFRLTNDGSRVARLDGWTAEAIEEGMGLKYVRTRLEESWPGRWSLTSGRRGESWEVVIGTSAT